MGSPCLGHINYDIFIDINELADTMAKETTLQTFIEFPVSAPHLTSAASSYIMSVR